MPKVTFERECVTVDARSDESVLDVAERTGITVFRGMWPELHCGKSRGWCRRCKVWLKPADQNSAATEQLACKVPVQTDLVVHTRAGGPVVKANMDWQTNPEHSKWKDRWDKRHENKGAPEDEEEAAPE